MIRIRLGHLLLDRDMKLKELAEQTGLAVNNLSVLKTNKARAIRFSTLDTLCRVLQCTPGELIEFVPDKAADVYSAAVDRTAHGESRPGYGVHDT